MQLPDVPKPLLVIVGPTAVGKTEFSLRIAKKLGGEIISADSRLLYRGMNIGTAKPSQAQLKQITHYLVDIINPDQPWSLALYQDEFKRVIEEIHHREGLPILVGGTGQYIRAILEGWSPPVQPPENGLRNHLEKIGRVNGSRELFRYLENLDPQAAKIIDPSNLRRIIRALEVIYLTGRLFSDQRKKVGTTYSYLILGLKRPRDELFARIDERLNQMLKNGLINEVNDLLEKGYSSELPSFESIGYKQIAKFIKGESTLDNALMEIKKHSHQFVRRQANWFKESDPQIHWLDTNNDNIIEKSLSVITDERNWIIPRNG